MSSLAKRLEQSFLTFEEFLARTSEEDRAFLGGRDFLDERFFFDREARERFAAACCGMANGKGGWIVFGAERSEQGNETDKDVFAVEGVADAARLEQELRAILRETAWLSANPISSFHPMPSLSSSFFSSSDSLDSLSGSSSGAHSDEPKTLLAVKVETAEWFLRPVCVKADFSPAREKEKSDACGASSCAACAVYRRVEGNNVVSGLDIRFRMALDALECARDDRPVPGLSVRDLDIESVVSFRRALLARCPHWVNLCEVEFLKRALVLDDDEKVTRAGQLLLGASPELSGKGKDKKNRENAPLCLRSKASRSKDLRPEDFNSKDFNSKEEKRRFAPNLWSAYSGILPELRDSLAENCANAVCECFMNALLHADYDTGRVVVDMNTDINEEGKVEEFIHFSNPGLPRAHGAGSARNYRLLRMFRLAGAVREPSEARRTHEKRGKLGEKRVCGLEIIRAYDENFRLRWDTLELFTHAELRLEKGQEYEAASPETSAVLGWMPVVEDDSASPAETASKKNSLLGLKRVAAPSPQILLTSSDPEDAE
ncbi:MAG: hypothetical protein LBJ22_00045, partial [Synergistaceae bacterium]|nr:hypothetical protein [Synergistaceae bacterium]